MSLSPLILHLSFTCHWLYSSNSPFSSEHPSQLQTMKRLRGEADHVLLAVVWCCFLILLSTSYLSCITNTSSKQTPQRALESKDTSRTRTQNNTIHSFTSALDTATNYLCLSTNTKTQLVQISLFKPASISTQLGYTTLRLLEPLGAWLPRAA
ncbi:uncharacterized protein M421DRAFT_270272 [Didymella exigua CBS 183.55]|uniref:Uncharacterized protein n=1 Tax=Didymella exigua CBS 183.55 TaxID=1150837 RepID=A0A6A5R9R8_9PLEO|nr:uncharacterized protein M421DRAFT_270272 [Didymella exigua CBS 183.55]KAF1924965.1 hypothetical protein M421DRAFT_270272 [Didymella exigua CBS 183.55]